MNVSLLIPTLNEIEGMRRTMPQIRREWVDQIVVVDGGSTDGTVEYAESLGLVVVRQKKRGLRQGYLEALPHITGDAIITFSPDGNSLPERIPALVEKIREGHDLVIVSRYRDGAKSEDDSWYTALGNWVFTKIANVLFGGRYTDMIVIFRAFKKQLVYDLDLHKEESYAYAERWVGGMNIPWEALMSVRAAKRKLDVVEIPGDEPKRLDPERRLKLFRIGFAHLIQFAYEFFFWR
ncbi:glycosyltransferase family 2 protein [Candidatus Parcubacteria bacterium]|nr:MAG: glycosyltransferase family 2 protein [Candidatus Parcubacteria bacterium]